MTDHEQSLQALVEPTLARILAKYDAPDQPGAFVADQLHNDYDHYPDTCDGCRRVIVRQVIEESGLLDALARVREAARAELEHACDGCPPAGCAPRHAAERILAALDGPAP
jgi:hypothetical protein